MVKTIECFHSRGQHLCKFIGTKEGVYIRKEFNSHRTGFGTFHCFRTQIWQPWCHVKTHSSLHSAFYTDWLMKFLRKRSCTLLSCWIVPKNIVIESIPAHVQKRFYLMELLKNSGFGWQLQKMSVLKDDQLHQLWSPEIHVTDVQ